MTSPTFIMIAEHAGRLPLYHVDLYRTESLEEIRRLGLEEMLDGAGITAIEWAEKAELLLPLRAVRVHIRGAGDEPRIIEIAGALPAGRPAPGLDRSRLTDLRAAGRAGRDVAESVPSTGRYGVCGASPRVCRA